MIPRTTNAIELHGGPLDGRIHELPAILPLSRLPDAFGLPCDEDDPSDNVLHWYEARPDGHADYLYSRPSQ